MVELCLLELVLSVASVVNLEVLVDDLLEL